MTMDAVTAGMTPYRPSPLPSLPGPDAPGASARPQLPWGTPSCADDLAGWLGGARPGVAPGLSRRAVRPGPGGFLAERQPGGWACVAPEWGVDDDDAAGVVERYLAPGEQDRYIRLKPAVRPTWLLGRVAAKDAVRWWLADRGRAVEPTEVVLANEPSGRPVIDTAGSPSGRILDPLDLRVSIAHIAGAGVAIVAQGADVGIDVEEAAPRPRSFARVAFSAGERAERAEATSRPVSSGPHDAMDEHTWMAAAWCAKEAAGKADGTGLKGRPTRFVTHLVGPDLFRVGERLVRCARLDPIRWCSHAGHSLVVGWTLSAGRRPGADHRPGTEALLAGSRW